MTYIPVALRRLVIERANNRCEYCHLPDDVAYYVHEIDHIIAEKHTGQTTEANLSYSCAQCNRYKGSDLASVDPDTGEIIVLFHPRRDEWPVHFRVVGANIEGLTPKGRATALLLHFNDEAQVGVRQVLISQNRFPD